MERLRSVWVDESCIACYACETTLPVVFRVVEDIAMILGSVREDGITSINAERSPLNAAGLAECDGILEAAAGCPVEAIHLDRA